MYEECEIIVDTENEFYPQFVEEHVTATVPASLRRGDTVAVLDVRDVTVTTSW